jgi:hypothetical protein
MTTVCTHWLLVALGATSVVGCSRESAPDPLAPTAAVWTGEVPFVEGVVRDSVGTPVRGAEVFVGSRHTTRPSDPDACEVPLDALVRTVTDARGRYRIGVPRDSAGPAANCVLVLASLRGDTTGVGEPPRARSTPLSRPLTGDAVQADLVLRAAPAPPDRFRTPDDEWARLALTTVPGFAGLFLEGCSIVVNLTDPERQRAAAAAYVEAQFANRPVSGREGCPAGRRVEYRKVRYDFAQLRRWYDRASLLTSLKGSRASDIDEAKNRLEYEYDGPAAKRRAERALATLQVPHEAVVLSAPDQPVVSPADTFGPRNPVLGRPLARSFFVTRPAWSADGKQILFLSAEGMQNTHFTLHAVDVASAEVRSLARVPGTNTGRMDVQVARGTGTVFLSLSGSTDRLRDVLYRVPASGGAPERVAEDLSWPWFAVSGDARRVAYASAPPRASPGADTLVVRDLSDGSRRAIGRLVGPARVPFSLSPDGTGLVYTVDPLGDAGQGGTWWVRLPGGEPQRILAQSGPSLRRSAVGAVRWEGREPRLLLVEHDSAAARIRFSEVDPTGTRRALGEVPGPVGLPSATAWSADGRRVALWVPIEIGPWACSGGVCISRRVVHYGLYVWDAGSARTAVVADVAASEGAGWLAFSPGAAQVGYTLTGRLYVSDATGTAR